MSVKRLAFAPYTQKVTIGWGSNPFGKLGLRAVGTQYKIVVTDYLSGKPVKGAEAVSDEVNALSDEQGKISLTVDDTSVATLSVKIDAPGYRAETLTLDATTSVTTPVILVSNKKTVFVSKESGKYDVYSSDIDGRDRKLLLAGSGLETSNISLVASPDNTQAALVSTRDNVRDNDGYLLYALTFINIDEGTSATVDHAQQLQLIDWTGDRLVYRMTIAGASGANPQRNRLVAYNYATNSRAQLATANQFNTVLSADGYIYYAASSSDPDAVLGLFRIKPDSSGRERLSDQEIWTGLRVDEHLFALQTPSGWVTYDTSSKKQQKIATPAQFNSLQFISDAGKDHVAWTDTRDGKGVLLLKDTTTDKTTNLVAQPGLTSPVRWLTDTILVYRVVTSTESADYVVSIQGGTPHKISNVTATYSYIQAY